MRGCSVYKFEWGQVGTLSIPDGSRLWSMSACNQFTSFIQAPKKTQVVGHPPHVNPSRLVITATG